MNNGINKIRVDLTGAPETALATLYGRALDADADRPILRDIYAKELVQRLDYDWSKTGITAKNAPSVTIRSAHFDGWARQFLAVHEDATVLHLGCGLDSRYLRLHPGPGVDWYDVDYPDVIALREQFYPPDGSYRLTPASVTELDWLSAVPADRPVLVLGEGLTMYLTEECGPALLRRLVERFPSGELQFDAFNRLAIRTQVLNTPVRRAGARLHWGIDGPDEVLRDVPGVRLLAAISVFDAETFRDVPRRYRVMARVMSLVPAWKNMEQFHRYAF
ncbi:MAG TPA: class I SAM-dependent methyltransferase [Mycobacterium sp.]|nr:class I SAM-dependent methyltransferase [Mycobacterium sp.]